MIELETLEKLEIEITNRIAQDRKILDEMREEVRPLRAQTRRIHPRSATAVSLVGTDGGSNRLRFDPFEVQLVRVVDSSRNEYCLEIISPRASMKELSRRHIDESGNPLTSLGKMMRFLEVTELSKLSPVFNEDPDELSPSWMNVYREMTEWAVLFELLREKDFGSDTVIVKDGFLRSKMFSGELFGKFHKGLEEAIRNQFERNRRRLFVCGIAKHTGVFQTYRVAMALEGVMRNAYPCFVEVPEIMEERVYKWSEWFKRTDKFVAGKLFFVKFGKGTNDPIWAFDVLLSQKTEAQTILGYLLEDAKDGFPIPLYPQCLQKAHEHAALVDFDMELLEDLICKVLRSGLGEKKWIVDELALQETDPAAARYG